MVYIFFFINSCFGELCKYCFDDDQSILSAKFDERILNIQDEKKDIFNNYDETVLVELIPDHKSLHELIDSIINGDDYVFKNSFKTERQVKTEQFLYARKNSNTYFSKLPLLVSKYEIVPNFNEFLNLNYLDIEKNFVYNYKSFTSKISLQVPIKGGMPDIGDFNALIYFCSFKQQHYFFNFKNKRDHNNVKRQLLSLEITNDRDCKFQILINKLPSSLCYDFRPDDELRFYNKNSCKFNGFVYFHDSIFNLWQFNGKDLIKCCKIEFSELSPRLTENSRPKTFLLNDQVYFCTYQKGFSRLSLLIYNKSNKEFQKYIFYSLYDNIHVGPQRDIEYNEVKIKEVFKLNSKIYVLCLVEYLLKGRWCKNEKYLVISFDGQNWNKVVGQFEMDYKYTLLTNNLLYALFVSPDGSFMSFDGVNIEKNNTFKLPNCLKHHDRPIQHYFW